IDVDAIGPSLLRLGHLLSQASKVRRENRSGKLHTAFVHILNSSWLQLSDRSREARSTIRLLSDTLVIAYLDSGRLKDTLNGLIQHGVELSIGLLGREPFCKSPRKAGDDAVIPAQAVVGFFPRITARQRNHP